MKKADTILIVLVLGIAFIYSIVGWIQPAASGEPVAVVTVDTVLKGSYPLSSNPEVVIPIDRGTRRNVVVVGNGSVRMLEANCPDQVCVKTGAISKVGQTIVCLPNKVVVEIKGSGGAQIDELAQ